MNYSSLLRKFFTFVLIVVGFTSILSAQSTITVGKQPLAIIPVENTVHVFCNGDDMNFNNIYEPDSGDVAASWWILDAQTQTVLKHREFTDQYLPFPFRAGIGYDTLYVGAGNHVSTFNINTQEMIQDKAIIVPDSVGTIHAVSVQIEGDEHTAVAVMSCIKDYLTPGYIIAAANGFTYILPPTKIGPQQVVNYTNPNDSSDNAAILCEGSFGVENSFLQLNNGFTSTDILLGNGGNHIFYQGKDHDSMYVTVNGSHKVVIVDLKTQAIVKTISTGTTEYNGPRESVIIGKTLFVTTYNSDVREFNIETGAMTGILESKGKPEGLTVINGKLWVANAFIEKSYTVGNTIAVFDSPLAVEEYFTENKNIVFPNPARTSTSISTTFNGQVNIPVQIEVYSVSGAKLFSTTTFTGNNGEVNYSLPIQGNNLTSGTYFVRLSAANRVQTSRLTVVE
ncbi:MAG: T9SS type A sorting domain-containing protein [Ignavibacteriae bacterium]|nr:T9SS type A sorting domain-containing protein [Ignavibacteriota bacterium]